MNKKYNYPLLIAMCLAQLFVPAKMIMDQENILVNGKTFKFKTAPVDPEDPFRGKYLALNFPDNSVEVSENEGWKRGMTVYALLVTDSAGFTHIGTVVQHEPAGDQDYLKTTVEYLSRWKTNRLTVEYPFNRYYLEESGAAEVEKRYNKAARDTSLASYALVSIRKGDALLKDLVIGGVSINQLTSEP
jgi:uncharacterized membrane-anchored protein